MDNICLGIEFGSTRIKAVLIDDKYAPVAEGSHGWENRFENGIWTYSEEDIKNGLQSAFKSLSEDYAAKFKKPLKSVSAMGISGMMHGYLAFDENDRLLTPFRTWRNTCTGQAANELTELFGFNIPQRWSIAHLYQAVMNREEHVGKIAHITTLAGYVHYLLTGERAVGTGEAAGIFPLDDSGEYNADMLDKFNRLVSEKGCGFDIRELLPKINTAGTRGAVLSKEGALLLDPTGVFEAGVPVCPPEGDAGTGMVATNSVRVGTGNVSAGTSIFSMLVLDEPLKGVYPEIDVVATPDGKPVAMVHCNNCCSELDAWVNVFGEFGKLTGKDISTGELYEMLYKNALSGDPDCGGVTAYNFLSGEPVAGAESGRPMYFRRPDGSFNLANFFRAELYAAFATLKMGMDILSENEGVSDCKITGHGGLFKVRGVAQKFLADALGAEVSVMKTAGEGGAWGMALLAAFMLSEEKKLDVWLSENVFSQMESETISPDKIGTEGFKRFMENYRNGLKAQYAAAHSS